MASRERDLRQRRRRVDLAGAASVTRRPPLDITADRTIGIRELVGRLGDPALAVVDVRPLAAYNGWRLSGEARGGHIPGAISFPSGWLDRIDEAELKRLLREKGLLGERGVVLYGDRPVDATRLAARVRQLGQQDVRILVPGWGEWSAAQDLPVERLANYSALVHTEWLRDVLDGRSPEASPAGRFLLFHVNFGDPGEYLEGHIPGALHLDTNRLEDPADWNRRPPGELDATLRALGITHDSTVVLYGREIEGRATDRWPGRRAGHIAATRAALILCYAGVDDVRVLDGGYDGWVRGGHELETTEREPSPVQAFGRPIPHRPQLIVDIDEAKSILADREGGALVSVRTWQEHIGQVSGYDYIGRVGRIAGDVWGNGGSDSDGMRHYRTVDNTMRPYPEIVANWAAAGIVPAKRVAFYCGTGWRAAEAWFCAWLAGWPRISVYDGGWFEWSRDPAINAIEVGEPPGNIAP